MKTRLLLGLAACLFVLIPARAADWPQWRGPDRSGVSKETGLLKAWPTGGPKLLWTYTETGLGYSGPAIVGNRLYTMGGRGDTEFVFALDTAKGTETWSTAVGPLFDFKGNSWGKGPRSTPTIDGDHIFALGGQGELVCLETATGKKVWQHNLFKEFNGDIMDNSGPPRTGWGYVEGPLVDGDRVICTPGGKDGTLLAFDKHTGNVLWRTKNITDKAPYSSIIIGDVGGIRHYIQMTDKGVIGVAPEDGRLLWRLGEDHDDLVIRTAIFHGGLVFTTVGMARASVLLKLTANGNKITAAKVYENKNVKNELGGVVLVDEHIYGFSDGRGWVCAELSKNKGDIVWANKRKLGKGSVTCADGRLYCYDEEEGTVALVEAKPATSGWKETGRFTIPQQTKQRPPSGKIWTHPVVANGKLYLRDQELLFCYDVSDKNATSK
jgi:outer membrane protein assembly factor BamB